jgi:hypothetical protein
MEDAAIVKVAGLREIHTKGSHGLRFNCFPVAS